MHSSHFTQDPSAEAQGPHHEAETDARITAYLANLPAGSYKSRQQMDAERARAVYPNLTDEAAIAAYDAAIYERLAETQHAYQRQRLGL